MKDLPTKWFSKTIKNVSKNISLRKININNTISINNSLVIKSNQSYSRHVIEKVHYSTYSKYFRLETTCSKNRYTNNNVKKYSSLSCDFKKNEFPLATKGKTKTKMKHYSNTNNNNILLQNIKEGKGNSSKSLFLLTFNRKLHFAASHSSLYTSTMSSSTASPQDREVLPSNVYPDHYNLTLEPNFKDFTFDGTVVIDLNVKESTKSVILNGIELKVQSASVNTNGTSYDTTSIDYIEETQRIAFYFPKALEKGSKTSLTIKFTGILNDKMAGFYRSSYTAEDGSTQYLATTQMEPTDARRAFPCFDEPAVKSTFTITLIADKHLTALSNMNEVDEKILSNGKKSVTFAKTPLMSTYLLAFIVGDLRYVESNTFRLPVRVYATPGSEHLGKFSLELAANTLKFFEKTFDIEYPLPKMDMVAIPDFSAGAMENWGLITYRVVDLLIDEETAGVNTKQRVAEVVQHELAHQWFGNLVTMDWWEGLWLNEGFATWMSWYSCNQFYPEWKVWQQYVIDNLQRALGLDNLRSSHPIEVPVKRADEINQIFDAISYSKGSCILRMLSKHLGEDVFFQGIQKYLKKHKYGNTKTSDLWDALSEASGKNVSQTMNVWTKQVGYPIISVVEDGSKVTFRQNRYLSEGKPTKEEDSTIYPVFLDLRTKSGIKEVTLNERELTIDLKDDVKFFKVNADQSGIYRTAYSPERLNNIASSASLLSTEDRAGIIADAGALMISGHQNAVSLLNLLQKWKNETEYVVWSEMLSRLNSVRAASKFEDKSFIDALKAFQRDFTSKKVQELGWSFSKSDSPLTQQLKTLLFSASNSANNEKTVDDAIAQFKSYVAGNKSAIHPNVKGSVFSTAVRNLGEPAWNELYKIYKNPISTDEKNTALRSIGVSKEPELIKKTLHLLLDGTVRAQDIYLPMVGLVSHREGVEALWGWLKGNWDEIEKVLPPGLSMLSSVVTIATSSYTTKEALKEIESFFSTKKTKGYDKGLAQSLESIRIKIAFIDRERENVKDWLKENKYL